LALDVPGFQTRMPGCFEARSKAVRCASCSPNDSHAGAPRKKREIGMPPLKASGARRNASGRASMSGLVLHANLSPPKANKTVSFFVSFLRGAPQSGILFLVSIARATARRVYHCRPWLSDVSHLRGAPTRFLARPGCGGRRCSRTEARYESGALGGLPRTFRLLSSFGEARLTWIEARSPSPRWTARVSTGHP
jgi:hypothetical protein